MKKRCSLTAVIFLLFLLTVTSLKGCGLINKTSSSFDRYTDLLFKNSVSSNSISLHFTLKDPEAFGITEDPLTFGSYSAGTDALHACAENALAALHQFDRRFLSDSQKITYDILDFDFHCSLSSAKYYYYAEPLSPLVGVQSQIPLLLSEYAFYDENDIITYLKLIKTFPDYMESLIKFEETKSQKGLFMSESQCRSLISECQTFLSLKDDSGLVSSFNNRIEMLPLTKKQKSDYIHQNISYLNTFFFPSYESLINSLEDLCVRGSQSRGLCFLPEGRDYYSCLVRASTGSDRTVSELWKMITEQVASDLLAVSKSRAIPSGAELSDSNPSSVLSYLRTCIEEDFPTPDTRCTYQVKYVPEALSPYLSPAFYLIPPLDDSYRENTVYINPPHIRDDLSLLTTLAHEGFPGHLYQTVYFASTSPPPIRSFINFGGYSEGWATYCEMISYNYAPLSKEDAGFYQHSASLMLGLYAMADMGIHDRGWSLSDTRAFFSDYGIIDDGIVAEIHNMILSSPANYLKYYVGYLEFLTLKKEAISISDDNFSQKKFHTAILDLGPAPFSVLRRGVLEAFR